MVRRQVARFPRDHPRSKTCRGTSARLRRHPNTTRNAETAHRPQGLTFSTGSALVLRYLPSAVAAQAWRTFSGRVPFFSPCSQRTFWRFAAICSSLKFLVCAGGQGPLMAGRSLPPARKRVAPEHDRSHRHLHRAPPLHRPIERSVRRSPHTGRGETVVSAAAGGRETRRWMARCRCIKHRACRFSVALA
jgi:hypothetical protein